MSRFGRQRQMGMGLTSIPMFSKINFALSGQSITNVSSVNTPQGCSAKFTKFQLGSLPKDVSVSTSAADLTNSASGTTPACFFNHAFRMPWKTFRDTLGSCGFAISTANSLRTYKGRVFVTHEDFSSDLAAQATRPAATNFYDINLSVANDGTSNVTNNTGTEKPYNADFKVDELSYTKDNDGVVKASIAYSLSTNWPYQVQLPSTDAKTHLISDASAPNVSFAGLRLLDNNNYPRGAFSHNFMNNLDGTKQLNGSACNAAGQTCAFHAVLSFTWKPTVGFNDSCSLSSGANNFQLDFVLACAGLTNSLCGKRMRLSLALPLLGAFKIQGSTDFCAAPSTSFPLSWSKPFDVTSNSRKIGEAIEAKGTLRIEKQLSALAIYDFSVSRADLTGSWPLWTPGELLRR